MQGSEDGDGDFAANKGGEALNLDANDDFNDSEDVDEVEEDADTGAAKKVGVASGAKPASGQ